MSLKTESIDLFTLNTNEYLLQISKILSAISSNFTYKNILQKINNIINLIIRDLYLTSTFKSNLNLTFSLN